MRFKLAYVSLLFILISLESLAYIPSGYIGCFEDSVSGVLKGLIKDFIPNGGDRCKRFCSTVGYRYAGTEAGVECFCGHTIRQRKLANDCNEKCEGNPKEICGGIWRISIYDTWHCITKPCENGATCIDVDAERYTCICTKEWTGQKCEHESLSTIQTTKATTRQINTSTPAEAQSSRAITKPADSNISASSETMPNVTYSPFKEPTGQTLIKTAFIIVPAAVVLGGIFVVVLIVLVLKKRRQHINANHSVNMGASNLLYNTMDINVTVPRTTAMQSRTQITQPNGTEETRSQTANSDIKISDYVNVKDCQADGSYEVLQSYSVQDSEYTSIVLPNAQANEYQTYETLNKDTVPDDVYHQLQFKK